MLVGCRPADTSTTAVQEASPTPRSTALPPLPTVSPLGSSQNPVFIALVPTDRDAADSAAERLSDALAEQSDLEIRFTLVERPAEALAALCASPGGTISAAWIDGLTHAAAEALACGDAALVGERATGRTRRTTQTVQIVVRASGTIDRIEQLEDKPFCRLGVNDLNSWLLPSLLLRASGIDPVSELGRVRDYDDNEALIEGLIARECDAAGISENELANLSADAIEAVTSVASVEVPFGVLVYPQEIDLALRERIDAALQTLTTDQEQAEAVRVLFGQDGLRIPVPEDFEPLVNLIERAGLDLAVFGSP